ncbi:MAG: alpha-ketoacid dehydrogenase subunit beta [Chloroflexi bacterium]|nr:alpha-ketoacid dehydrogenase subunit beta [Chloroflexota bacterium]
MARLSFAEALVEGMRHELRTDERVFLMGQDIGKMGGVMGGSRGLIEEFGPRRIRETPISESAMVGAAIGSAMVGKRPIVEISFGEFLPTCMSQIVLQAANLHYMTAGAVDVSMVLRTRIGDGPYRGHPQCYESWFAHVPGLKVLMPSTPTDARNLMIAAIRDPNPVIFFEHMWLYHGVREEVDDFPVAATIGKAAIRRVGRDVTVVATGWMVHKALEAAETLALEGIEVEVVDLVSLAPLDIDTVASSVRRTSRIVVAHEAWKIGGIGAEVTAAITEACFFDLEAPPVRVGAPHHPLPMAKPLRDAFLPDVDDLLRAIRQAMAS